MAPMNTKPVQDRNYVYMPNPLVREEAPKKEEPDVEIALSHLMDAASRLSAVTLHLTDRLEIGGVMRQDPGATPMSETVRGSGCRVSEMIRDVARGLEGLTETVDRTITRLCV